MILASDVFESGAAVDRLLFGTLLGLDTADVVLSAVVAVLATAGALALGRTWSAVGFDPDGARALGLPAGRADLLLLALVAVAAVAAIPAVGALLVTAIYVLPAAAARMLTGSIRGLVACALGAGARRGRGRPLPGVLARRARRSARGRARGARVPAGGGRHAEGGRRERARRDRRAARRGLRRRARARARLARGATRASRSACSARTAAARRRCSACSSASSSRTTGGSSSAAVPRTWPRPSARGSTSR